jgi:Tfp pilus assembly protein PilF
MQDKIEKLYCLARDRFHENDLAEAIVSLKALLQLDFKHLDAHFLLAQIYQQDQSYELSNQHFRSCLDEGCNHVDIHKLIAFNNMQLGLFKDAIYQLQKHLKQHKDDADAYALLGGIYTKQQQYHYAKKVYLEAIALDPKTAAYYLKLAHIFHTEGDPHAALLEVQKALAMDHNYHEAHFLAATLYAQMNKDEQAIEHYKKAVAINPVIPIYYNNLAVSLNKLDRHDEALLEQKTALALDPDNIHFQSNLKKM